MRWHLRPGLEFGQFCRFQQSDGRDARLTMEDGRGCPLTIRAARTPVLKGPGTPVSHSRGFAFSERGSFMPWMNLVEFSFYLVETFALPFAILVFLIERRKQLAVDEEEIYQRLSDEYTNFLKLVLDNSDLQLLRKNAPSGQLTEEQMERKLALFGILVSIFERAYILVFEERMSKQTRRLWSSWEDYMREWCRRPDFRQALPELLEGEDPDFRSHIERIAQNAIAAGAKSALQEGAKK
jgi:hypothetical protein